MHRFALNIAQKCLAAWIRRERWAAYSAVPDSLAGLKGKRGVGDGREGRGKREREWEREAEGRKVREKGGGKEDVIFLLSDFMATPMQQPRTM